MEELTVLMLQLNAPLQSWGCDSRFETRSAGMGPTKSGIAGIACAALGAPKGSEQEKLILQQINALHMVTICPMSTGPKHSLRLSDFHTISGSRKAGSAAIPYFQYLAKSHKKKPSTQLSHREYFSQTTFIVLLRSSNIDFLDTLCSALKNPHWGLWLGRKSCIPAAPIVLHPPCTPDKAQDIIRARYPNTDLEIMSDVHSPNETTDILSDAPICFGSPNSSGPDERQYAPRRINRTISIAQNNATPGGFFQF